MNNKRGVLHLKLRESFNTTTMEISAILAKITLEGVQLVGANSQEVSPTHMSLTTEEVLKLAEGCQQVNN